MAIIGDVFPEDRRAGRPLLDDRIRTGRSWGFLWSLSRTNYAAYSVHVLASAEFCRCALPFACRARWHVGKSHTHPPVARERFRTSVISIVRADVMLMLGSFTVFRI